MHILPSRITPVRISITLLLAATAIVITAMAANAGPVSGTIGGSVSYLSTTTIESGQTLRFDPNQDTTLEVWGNLIVEGTLEMNPIAGVTHILRFMDVDEAAFVGGGLEVLESDRGLWVVGSGVLDLKGEEKVGWNRTGTDPTWKSTDELRVAPTAVGDYGKDGFSSFTLGSSVPRADASLPPAEVINLTRSVHIEGTTSGRSHVTILSSAPQSIKYTEFRHLGPRQDGGDGLTVGVIGRYALHFHHAGDGSRGSIVEGNVFRESGNRAFVPHASHGISAIDNVAYDVFGTAFWWDKGDGNETHDSLWQHNFTGYIRVDPVYRGYLLSGFSLALGDGNVAIDNAAAGVLGNKDCSGFIWPGLGSGEESGIWEFRGNVAHNTQCHGSHVWQNNPFVHLIEDFVSYRNATAGVSHGAYANEYTYFDLYLFENGVSGIVNHTSAGQPGVNLISQSFNCVTVVNSPVAVTILESSAQGNGSPAAYNYLTLINTPELVVVDQAALDAGQTLENRATFNYLNEPCPADLNPTKPSPQDPSAETVGMQDPGSGLWHLRDSGGGVTTFYYGNPGDVPFAGDWNCDGVDTPGLFRQSDAYAYLRNSNTQGIADIRFFFGNPSDIPLAGDFNGDGCDTLSIYRPSEQRFYIINELGEDEGGLGAAEYSFGLGDPGDTPVVGDFDGDGIDEVGLHRQSTGLFFYRTTLTTGPASNEFSIGNPGDRMIAGDWDGTDGVDTPAIFRPGDSTFYFWNTLSGGNPFESLTWGKPGFLPFAGVFGVLPGGGAIASVEP